MAAPRQPRGRCRLCGGSMLDPLLDAPSAFGRYSATHLRCRKRQLYAKRAADTVARLAWFGIVPGKRVRLEDYKRTNGTSCAGRLRKKFTTVGPYRSWQTCECGTEYIGGHNAVRCALCQAAYSRRQKERYHLMNREKNCAYMKAYVARRKADGTWKRSPARDRVATAAANALRHGSAGDSARRHLAAAEARALVDSGRPRRPQRTS